MQMLDIRMYDGSRHFSSLPESEPWDRLHEHLVALEGVCVTRFLSDGVTEVWIDFDFSGERFSINNQLGEYWFFVESPECADVVLEQVVAHCSHLLQ